MIESLSTSQLVLSKPRKIELPFAWVEHIPFAFFLVESLRPSLIVELGTHTGNSFNALCEAVERTGLPARCFAVDTWQGDEHAGAYDSSIYDALFAYQKENYDSFASLLRMTFDDALARFEDGSIDLLHIDGLHTYEAVKHDFDTWLPKVAPGGVILLHDIAVREHDFGVWRLWDEIKMSFRTAEFEHGYGLGVVFVPGAWEMEHDRLRQMLSQEDAKHLFATLGRGILLEAENSKLQREQQSLLELLRAETGQLREQIATHVSDLELLSLPHYLYAQVSCDTGTGFREDLTYRMHPTGTEIQFSYAPESSIAELRGIFLMPINCPANISKATIKVVDLNGNEFALQSTSSEGITEISEGQLEVNGDFPRVFFTEGLPSSSVVEIQVSYQILSLGSKLIEGLRADNRTALARLAETESALVRREFENDLLRHTQIEMLNSLSWRCTAPIRALLSWTRSRSNVSAPGNQEVSN